MQSQAFILSTAVMLPLVTAFSGHLNLEEPRAVSSNYTWVYTYPSSQETAPDVSEVTWELDDGTLDTRICDGCDHHFCTLKKSFTAEVDEHGSWWTSWCPVKGQTTSGKGQMVTLGQSVETSMTISGEVEFKAPIGDALNMKLGGSISKSKGWQTSVGCTNLDGQPHGFWIQEKMGWSTVKGTITYENIGDCKHDPPAPEKKTIHVNFPDPDGTGFREFQTTCEWAIPADDFNFCDLKSDKCVVPSQC